MLSEDEKNLQEYLEGFITPERKQRMSTVLEQRTRYITCVLEDLFDPRNGSAVIRHCDALGIHELHAIENKHHFQSDNQVDLGTAQWLDMKVYRKPHGRPNSVKTRRRAAQVSQTGGAVLSPPPNTRTTEVLSELKSRGYRIVATSPHAADDALPETLDLAAGPVAVVFGTEKHGISDDVHKAADVFLRIPMFGFVESFNLSASAAIVFHVLSGRLRAEELPWRLSPEDAERVMYEWIRRTAPHAEKLIERFEAESALEPEKD